MWQVFTPKRREIVYVISNHDTDIASLNKPYNSTASQFSFAFLHMHLQSISSLLSKQNSERLGECLSLIHRYLQYTVCCNRQVVIF